MRTNTAAALILLILMTSGVRVDARGGGHGHAALVGHGTHGEESEADRQRDEQYAKAISEEEERLTKKLKSICRGC
jgi:hypothetical protein